MMMMMIIMIRRRREWSHNYMTFRVTIHDACLCAFDNPLTQGGGDEGV